MPPGLETPVLSVDAGKMRRIDTRNVENLFGMWSGEHDPNCTRLDLFMNTNRPLFAVFSKCASSMEDGRRLENLSWRVWNRELLCCEPQPQLATTPAIDIASPRPARSDVPALSTSVDSAISDASDRSENIRHSLTKPVAITPTKVGNADSIQHVSRGKEKHITSIDLEKMVSSIQEQEEQPWPLPQSITDAIPPCTNIAPRPSSPSIRTSIRSSDSSTSTAPRSSPESDCSGPETAGSDTSVEPISSSHSVVRGFSLNVSSSYRSNTHLAAPQRSAMPIQHTKVSDVTKSKVAFSLGGASSGDEGSSFEDRVSGHHAKSSSLTAGLQLPLHGKKQTSFKDELESLAKSHLNVDVFEESDEDEQESAIEDDDDNEVDDDGSDWEDDGSESGELVEDKQLFKRIDSKPNLVSRRSLLTTMMNEPDRAAAFQDMASQSTPALKRSRRSSPNGPSLGNAPEENPTVTLPHTMTKSKPIIMTTSNTHPPALSPRTTRRNMLASEMTESLRKHLLWERQQISTTAKAVLKRRHTAYDITKLSEYPSEREGQTSKTNSWNHFYDTSAEYHQAGW